MSNEDFPPRYTPRSKTQAKSKPPADPPLFESYSDLIIAIDFGTTFTGVAYTHTTGAKDTTPSTEDVVKAAEKVFVIRSWPSQGNRFTEKTPSVLAYNTTPPTWGANVKVKDEPRIAHFKLGLQEDIGKPYLKPNTPKAAKSVLGDYLTNHKWKHPALPTKMAVDYTADYLTCIVEYVLKEVLPSRYGAKFLHNQQISYVITVPAIWSDKAKELTRQAAVTAGIPRNKLILITEPEAAALFCVTLCKQVDLRKGDQFLICDAGGGTVVRFPFPFN